MASKPDDKKLDVSSSIRRCAKVRERRGPSFIVVLIVKDIRCENTWTIAFPGALIATSGVVELRVMDEWQRVNEIAAVFQSSITTGDWLTVAAIVHLLAPAPGAWRVMPQVHGRQSPNAGGTDVHKQGVVWASSFFRRIYPGCLRGTLCHRVQIARCSALRRLLFAL